MCEQSKSREGGLSWLVVLEDTAHHVREGGAYKWMVTRSPLGKHRLMKAPLLFSVWDSMGWWVFLSQLNSGNTFTHCAHTELCFLDGSKSSQLVSEYEPPSLACTH